MCVGALAGECVRVWVSMRVRARVRAGVRACRLIGAYIGMYDLAILIDIDLDAGK